MHSEFISLSKNNMVTTFHFTFWFLTFSNYEDKYEAKQESYLQDSLNTNQYSTVLKRANNMHVVFNRRCSPVRTSLENIVGCSSLLL